MEFSLYTCEKNHRNFQEKLREYGILWKNEKRLVILRHRVRVIFHRIILIAQSFLKISVMFFTCVEST